MAKRTCPVGHAVPAAALFCVACGARVARLATERGQLVVRPIGETKAVLAYALVARGKQLALADDDDLDVRRAVALDARSGPAGHAKVTAGDVLVAWQEGREWIEASVEET
ncbi:MAG: hypothetical protein IT379_00315 [Deltaproteobacteria bacterium]|nr:hypothetical protein [Deltaproteobacteria bacterium]